MIKRIEELREQCVTEIYDRVEEEYNIPQGNFGKWMRSKATVS